MVSPASSPVRAALARAASRVRRPDDTSDSDRAIDLESKLPAASVHPRTAAESGSSPPPPGDVIVVDEEDVATASAGSPQRSSARVAVRVSAAIGRKPSKRVTTRSGQATGSATAAPKKRKTTSCSPR
ncbi:hypothetical protein ON010_g2878 [Phytophthora cinnamomi]|nr:hypothetical protein ON010_g2878 [Phytophthora cinnamomi]